MKENVFVARLFWYRFKFENGCTTDRHVEVLTVVLMSTIPH